MAGRLWEIRPTRRLVSARIALQVGGPRGCTRNTSIHIIHRERERGRSLELFRSWNCFPPFFWILLTMEISRMAIWPAAVWMARQTLLKWRNYKHLWGYAVFLHHHHHFIPPRWNNWIVDVLSHCRLSPSVCFLYIWLFRLSLSHSSGGFKWKVRNKKPPKSWTCGASIGQTIQLFW
jgi:hypothetical protein